MKEPFFSKQVHNSITILFILLLFSSVHAQVKINEVMVRPAGNQGLILFNGNSGNEYVELYNTGCTSVNVSGYFIACRQDFAGTTSGGAFRIPNVAAAVIPPGGHLVLGTSTSSADPNSIDIKLPSYNANYCLNNAGYNFILANADGWVALFDATGVPVDAAYWSSTAGNISQVADFGGAPCLPAGSSGGVVLESAQQINSGYPGVLTYVGANPAAGATFSRIPDGGTWQAGVAPSVNDLTVGNCNGGNCQQVSTIAFTAARTQPSCGSSNGSITITVTTPGVASFAWSANAATSNNATASNLAEGTYSVTVTQNGCAKDTSITLNSSNGITLTLTNVVNPTCGSSNGSVSVNLTSPGVASYSWSTNANTGNNATASNLTGGTYSVTVTQNGCTKDTSITLNSSNGVTLTLTNVVNPTCGSSNGSVSVNLTSPGVASYSWSANANTGNNATASNLTGGTYSVTVTQNGCTKDTSITLTSPNGVILTLTNPVNPTCAGNDGSITVNLAGGSAPYNLTIDTGGTPINLSVPFPISQIVGSASAGTINVSVTDGAGCTANASATLTAPTNCCAFSLSANITQAACGSANGSIAVTATNGSGNYSYTWSSNAGTGNATTAGSLASGVYLLTVTDNGFANCFIDTSFTIANPNAPVINSVNTTNETCAGSGDGTISVIASGGTGILTYTWSANAATGNSASAVNLTAGSYSFTVSDINNCQSTGNANVQSNICCTLQTSATSANTTCGLNNGSVSVTVSTPGTTPYTYSLNGGVGQASGNFNSLASGNYTVITNDNSGCSDTTFVSVGASSNTLNVTITSTDVSCFGYSDGTATATVSGGTPAYLYQWSTGDATVTIQNLIAGSYNLTVTDNDNCTASATAIINEPQSLFLNIGNDTTVCNGNPVLLDAGGGFSSYNWSNGSTVQTINVQAQGTYQITVTDNNGCTATDALNISISSGTQVTLTDDITIYSGESTGISATVAGNNNGFFAWSPVDFLSCIDCQNIVATPAVNAVYTVTYIDAVGCVSTDSINILVLPVGDVFFPTAFSPNGDGNNEVYRAAGSSVKQFRLAIYNRWGEKVFESNNFSDGWDGYYKGAQQPTGVYVYASTVTLLNNKTREYKGSITLIR